jgi:zinc protease
VTGAQDPLRIEYCRGRDGLDLVRQAPPPGARSFSATFVAPAGWAFDPSGSEGLARLANHLVPSAAGPYDRAELARKLDRAGATLSKQCAPESAEVTIWGPGTAWKELLGLLAEVALHPRFDTADVARARRQFVERQLREESQPAHRADRELLRSVFPAGHPYRGTGLGDRRSLARITRHDLVRFHERRYTEGGALLVATVPERRTALEDEVRRRFKEMGSSLGAPPRLPALARGRSSLRTIDLPGQSQVEVRLGGGSIPRGDPRYPAAFLANEILGGRPLLQRLFQRIRERGGLAYHASSDLEAMRWGGYWVAQAGTSAANWRRVARLVDEEVERIRTEKVPARELDRIRESAIGEIPLSLETTSDAHELAVDAAYHRLPEDHWDRWPQRLREVRPTEIAEAAGVAFDPTSEVTVVAGPLAPRAEGRPRTS